MRVAHQFDRSPVARNPTLREVAEQRYISFEAMLQRNMKVEKAAQSNPSSPDTTSRQFVAKLASVTTHSRRRTDAFKHKQS
jgi:hypothetical protein